VFITAITKLFAGGSEIRLLFHKIEIKSKFTTVLNSGKLALNLLCLPFENVLSNFFLKYKFWDITKRCK